MLFNFQNDSRLRTNKTRDREYENSGYEKYDSGIRLGEPRVSNEGFPI
jgi:hypothetical protein